MSTRNMIEAGHRADEAEREGAYGDLASRYAKLALSADALERQNAILRAAAAICSREHRGHTGRETAEAERGTGQPSATSHSADEVHGLYSSGATRQAASTARPT